MRLEKKKKLKHFIYFFLQSTQPKKN